MIQDQKLWTALITPMHNDGAIDYDCLENLIRRQEEAEWYAADWKHR